MTMAPDQGLGLMGLQASHTQFHEEGPGVRVVEQRRKPLCWDHGCNGRQFSTFSNLLRHQREKSGQAAKAVCPNCGAEFTRTTARNGHMQHEKCKRKSATSASVNTTNTTSTTSASNSNTTNNPLIPGHASHTDNHR